MSDIDIDIPFWAIAAAMLAWAFWPLTILAVGAAFWVWRSRGSKAALAARIAAVAFALLWAVSAGLRILWIADNVRQRALRDADVRSRQYTLARAATIGDLRLPAGTVVTHTANGRNDVEAVDLPAPTEIYGVPLVGHADLSSSGSIDGSGTLARDATIAGVPCAAGQNARFNDGTLIECTLSRPAVVRGIPCIGVVNLSAGVDCTLASDYRRFGFVWGAQTHVGDLGDDEVSFRIGSLPPTLQVLGLPLPAGSQVQFSKGRIDTIDLRDGPLRYGGCTIDLIVAKDRALYARPSGPCALPTVAPSGYLALPTNAVPLRI